MLAVIAIILIIFWFICLSISFTLGGFIHVFLALGIILLILQFVGGKNNLGDGI